MDRTDLNQRRGDASGVGRVVFRHLWERTFGKGRRMDAANCRVARSMEKLAQAHRAFADDVEKDDPALARDAIMLSVEWNYHAAQRRGRPAPSAPRSRRAWHRRFLG